MSMSEAYRFCADLKSNGDLRNDAVRNQIERRDLAPMVRVVVFANQKGYGFTIDEAKECAMEEYRTRYAIDKQPEPTDAQLSRAPGVYMLTNGALYGLGRLDHLGDW